jgi:hypothetical protein
VFFAARGRSVSVVSRVNTCDGIVISLATFGARVFRVEPTIRSLLSQSGEVDMIVVHDPGSGNSYDVSSFARAGAL